MLLCGIGDLEPGMKVGATVIHPHRPELNLLRPGVDLDAEMIRRLPRLGVSELWVHHDATSDLDAAVAPKLSQMQAAVYLQLKSDIAQLARVTVSTAQIQAYRRTISELVLELTVSSKYARLSRQLLDDPGDLFTHSTNVAFLSTLVGLELQTYVISQRPRLPRQHARDVVSLGLGAMLHDIGKTGMSLEARRHHEIHPDPDDSDTLDAYYRHVALGYDMLDGKGSPATARHVVLHHHQRFDGSGWADMSGSVKGRGRGPQNGMDIHIFNRIVAAANVLDNLLNRPGDNYPTVAALREFVSSRFEGWFDPVVRDLVVRRIPPFPIGSLVRLSDNRQAVVVTPNFGQPCYPAVRILEGHCRADDDQLSIVDLNVVPGLHIVECAGQRVEQFLFELGNLRPIETGGEPGPPEGNSWARAS